MKTLDSYITEKLVIGKNIIHKKIKVSTRDELRAILEERLAEDKNADLNDIDVSQITDMGVDSKNVGLLEDLDPHNIDISLWNVSKVENMCGMFYGCANFNSDINNWDVSNVEDMRYMFYGCKKFNCDLSKWDVSNVEDMRWMFEYCNSLKNKPSWYKE